MTQLGIEKTATLAVAKELLSRYKPSDYEQIARDGKFLSMLADLSVVELTDLVESIGPEQGETRAIAVYRLWISLTEKNPEHAFAALYNLGVHLRFMGATREGLEEFKKALARKPDFYQAAVNAGLCHEHLGDIPAALQTWRSALQTNEARTTLLNHIGRVLEDGKQYEASERALLSSLLTDPKQPDVIHHWTGVRAKSCAWPVFCPLPGLPRQDLIEATGALTLLALSDEMALHDRANARWIAKRYPKVATRLSPVEGYSHAKLRIGYMSSDYCQHPMAFLVAELFELHDRERFEVYGYCATKEDGSDVRRRVLAAFDKVTLIGSMSDEDVAKTIRDDEIDILIDLNGLTLGTRMAVLRWRPAPVQMTYLGYNGSVPLEELDYILADRYVIPPELAASYQPKPLYLPGCYQANDRKLPIAPRERRSDIGLPDDAFVFCCFSNNYKISEEMFAAWMQILKRSERSILWLYAENDASRANLVRHFAESGLDPKRLHLATRAAAEVYRSRLALADVFLDTFPYNAGTTASDALRVGLPIVTLAGQSFVSRMAGSLLHTIGLPECVTTSIDDYVEAAVALANDPAHYADVRGRIDDGSAWSRTLGDMPTFTRDYEATLRSVAITADASACASDQLAAA